MHTYWAILPIYIFQTLILSFIISFKTLDFFHKFSINLHLNMFKLDKWFIQLSKIIILIFEKSKTKFIRPALYKINLKEEQCLKKKILLLPSFLFFF